MCVVCVCVCVCVHVCVHVCVCRFTNTFESAGVHSHAISFHLLFVTLCVCVARRGTDARLPEKEGLMQPNKNWRKGILMGKFELLVYWDRLHYELSFGSRLLIATRFHPEAIALALLPLLSPSRPFVIFCQFMEVSVCVCAYTPNAHAHTAFPLYSLLCRCIPS